MDKTVETIMAKTAAYIEKTQPIIDAELDKQAEFVRRATQAAGVLAHRGVIDRRRVDEFVDKVAESPSSVWDFVEKLAASVSADGLGEGVAHKSASVTRDAFERVFFPEYSTHSGMIE